MSTERSAALPSSLLRHLPKALLLLGWLGFAIVFFAAWQARANIAPAALADSDSWGWLHPALQWVGGVGFHEEYEREWLYGAFIAFGLKATGGFSGFVILQQALGLLAGVFLWLTWLVWISFLPRNVFVEIAALALGLLVAAIHLLNPATLAFELSIRPEAILSAVVFGQLFCLLSFCRCRWKKPQAGKSLIFGALAVLLAFAAYGLKPNWALALLATVLPVFLGAFGKALPRLVRFGTPLLGLALVIALLWIPEKTLFLRNGKTRVVLPMTFFTIHADVIRQAFENDLSSPGTAPERKDFLEGFLPDFRREMENARIDIVTYKRLGFDPDYLMYRSTLFSILDTRYHMTKPQIVDFCYASYLSAWRSHPGGMARKIAVQMGYFFPPDPRTFFRPKFELSKLWAGTLDSLPANPGNQLNPATRSAYAGYLAELKKQAAGDIVLAGSRKFSEWANELSRIAVPLECLFAALLLAAIFWRPLAEFRLPGLVALLLFSAPLGNALTIAIVHALDNSRYRMSYGGFLALALAAMAIFSLAVLVRAGIFLYRRASNRPSPPSAN